MNHVIEWMILLLLTAPAIMMALTRSAWLIDYTIIILAFNRGLRRIVDYYVNGEFNPRSPISLSPLLVAMLLLIPAFQYRHRLTPPVRRILMLFGISLVLGFAVGLLLNKLAAIYSLAEWLSAIAAMAFAAVVPAAPQQADRWIKTAGWAALGVAIYGWWQYYTIPPWDAMWLEQSGMQGYMGQPLPTEMTLYSTLSERGPCGTFLAWAAIPMILSRRWRNPGGWLVIGFLLATIFLTGTRSNFVIIAAVAFLFPALSRGRGMFQTVVLTAVGILVFSQVINRIPGVERYTERYSAEAISGEGSSLEGRLGIYRSGLGDILSSPFGRGLGSSGMGKRAGNDEEQAQTVGDSGYLQIFAQFGWIGGVTFFSGLWLMWRELGARWKNRDGPFPRRDPHNLFVPATRALLLGTLLFLLVGDIFAGFSLIWVFFGRSLAPEHIPGGGPAMGRPPRGPARAGKPAPVEGA